MQSIHVIERKVERACCLEVSSIVFYVYFNYQLLIFNGRTLVEHHKKLRLESVAPPLPTMTFSDIWDHLRALTHFCAKPRYVYIHKKPLEQVL